MKSFTLLTCVFFVSIAQCATVSTDGTCGGSNGYTCTGSAFGNCCSQYGWCGTTPGHCETGCNSAFGTCANTQPSSTSKSSSAPQPTSTKKVSTDGTCAGSNGYTCQGSSFGNCCSQYGWCGSSPGHCGTNCNTAFGTCSGQTSSTTQSTTSSPTATPSVTVFQCLNTKNVPYKMTQDAEFNELIEPYNLRLPHKPAVVVLPTTNKHVQDAVLCASQSGIQVQAKSGGHSYANFASGGKDGMMMISLSSFTTVALDTSNGIVKVGGGVRLGNLADGIWTQGRKALSHGTCPGVGIGGHATHGGYGHTSRSWGLAMDAIVKAEVVLANGTLVTASSTQNKDIYWGIRGAADSLAIVTNFWLQTRDAPSSVTYFEIPFNGIWNSKSTFTNTLLHLQDFARNSSVVDSRISFGIYMDGYGSFAPSGAFFGSVSEFNSKIRPEFLRTLPAPANVIVTSYSYYDYLVKVGGKGTIKEPLTGYDEHDTFFAKSLTVPETSGLTSAAIGSFYDYVRRPGAQTNFFTIINLYGGPGSAINSKTTDFAAYSDRDSLWVIQNYGMAGTTTEFINGLNDAVTRAQPGTEFGAYLNYVDPSLDAATAHRVYYGEALYARLLSLKRAVDPKGVFWNPHAIGA